jgi:glycosyltransferase involved in cell wall biosynthesis
MLKTAAQQIREDADRKERRLKVALTGCGLGRVKRGFEVSTRRWFDVLKDHADLEVKLFAGGKVDSATEILNIPRDFLLNSVLAPIAVLNRRRIWEFAYGVEQVTFAIMLYGELCKFKPDVVWTKEAPMAHILLALKTMFGLDTKIVFANGGGFRPPTYAPFDHIQQLEQSSFDEAVSSGIAADKMTVIPNVISFRPSSLDREAARVRFGYKPDDWVVVCVAAWNIYHKRIDLLIEEVAALNDPQVKLLLIGHPEPDTARLKAQAKMALGDRVQWHTLEPEELAHALRAADVFVLPSINELFGSAAMEAVMSGLPIIVHPNGSTRLLIDAGLSTYDLRPKGAITNALKQVKENPPAPVALQKLAETAQVRFAAGSIADNFVKMIKATVIGAAVK